MLKTAAKYSPMGLAVQGSTRRADCRESWEKTKHTAGAAGKASTRPTHATAVFLQSPAGQLLVTGLSLAATSFRARGVKSIVGGPSRHPAISEGKDWKQCCSRPAPGADRPLPFLKLDPAAGMGDRRADHAAFGAGGGSSLKGALKRAAPRSLFDPGALKGAGTPQGPEGARKILQGKQPPSLSGWPSSRGRCVSKKLMAKRSLRRAVGG